MKKLDHELYEILLTLPKLPFLRMVRQDRRALNASRKQFFTDQATPTFVYPKALAFDANGYLEKLANAQKQIASTTAVEPLKALYQNKCEELRLRATCILAMQNGDDRTVTDCAKVMFGTPSQSLKTLQTELANRTQQTGHTHAKKIEAELFASLTRRVLDHYGLTDWRIKIVRRSNIQIGHNTKGRPPLVRIPANLSVSKVRAIRLLVHEIEIHALRTANGVQSPLNLLAIGCAGYIRTDEGLAMLYQDIKATKVHSLHMSGFWEAYTAALSAELSFTETFDELTQTISKESAWRLCVRAYRGIQHPSQQGLGFFRDHLYRSGRLAIESAIAEQGEQILPLLFAGKAGLSDLPILQALNIPAGKLPQLISRKIVLAELK